MFAKLMNHFRNAEKNAAHYRKLGLKLGGGFEILNGWDFGSEPWLIEIGDNVRITSGVRFVTHDGGVWVLRHKYNTRSILSYPISISLGKFESAITCILVLMPLLCRG